MTGLQVKRQCLLAEDGIRTTKCLSELAHGCLTEAFLPLHRTVCDDCISVKTSMSHRAWPAANEVELAGAFQKAYLNAGPFVHFPYPVNSRYGW